MLQVAHEVVITSTKHYRPPTQKCMCSQKSTEFICANPCCSQRQQSSVEQCLVESCDDFIAQENDQFKLEVKRVEFEFIKLKGKVQVQPTPYNHENMINKLEVGTTVTRLAPKKTSPFIT
jgi:hypothetical protein